MTSSAIRKGVKVGNLRFWLKSVRPNSKTVESDMARAGLHETGRTRKGMFLSLFLRQILVPMVVRSVDSEGGVPGSIGGGVEL